ncbi:MAG: hypothetical protein E7172_05505 [Firmicutes bacterium]|nr:hypothetical protein [Bacillota bacterium]
MKKHKKRDKIGLHPVMTYIILCFAVILLSGILSLFDVQATYNQISSITGEYQVTTEAVQSLFSLSGLKYIFTNTVANFANFTVLPHLIIILLGIGVMDKSGFLKTAFRLLTKKAKKTSVTFVMVLMCLMLSVIGDLSYIIMIPLSALLFLYGKRNPAIGIISSFAALTSGTGLSIIMTSIDSSLNKVTLLNASILTPTYLINFGSYFFIMLVAIIILAFIITNITENFVAKKLPKYEFEEESLEEELVLTKRKMKGLLVAGIASLIYLIIFIYNIIPGLPFSGNLLDYSQVLYIDKLFSIDSFFSNGFVFIISVLFVILGLSYGIGAKTITNNKEFINSLSHSLNGIGKVLVMIFAASTFISIFKQTNIGNFLVASFTNIINNSTFSGLPLLILVFVISALSTIFLPSSLSKWSILASVVVPKLMNLGITPEFAQIVFRFGESTMMGLTPVFAYFIVYIAYLDIYSQNEKSLKLSETIKYQSSYAIVVSLVLLALIIIWYIIGLPIGINSTVGL